MLSFKRQVLSSFTLIEILVSIMVVSFSLAILFGIVISTLESKKIIEKGVDREVTTALVVRELKRELESLYFSGGKGGGLYVEELGYFGRPFDRLIFTTYYGGEHREIEYTFEPEEEGEDENTARMIKRVDRKLDGDIKTGGYPLEVLSGVKMFDVRIYNNGSWHERWNLPDGVPDLIEITIAVSGMGNKKITAGAEAQEKVIRLFVEVGRKKLIGGKGRYIIPPTRR